MAEVLIINPNTSAVMTAEIEATARRVLPRDWKVLVSSAPAGPESLESWTDYHLASVCVLPLVEAHPKVQGIVLACFGDPGLYLLKEYCPVPVIGIAEASIAVSLLLGARFGILAGMGRAVELMDSMVRTYGLEARYAGTHPLEMRVLEFETDRGRTLERLVEAAEALRGRGAEVLLPGCAGLTGFAAALHARTGLPVIDPVEAGCRMLALVVSSRLRTSHVGLYATPAPQRMNNLDSLFSAAGAAVVGKTRQGRLPE